MIGENSNNNKTSFAVCMRTLALSMALLPSVSLVRAEMPKITGFVDTTYNYNFNRPASTSTAFRSYDNAANTILLNNAQLNISGSVGENTGYVIEPSFGSDAALNTSAGSGAADDFDLQEAYITYKVPNAPIDFKAGKFVTLEGIEVIESKDNFLISRGFLFGLAENYTNIGAMTTVSAPKIVSLSVGMINGWDVMRDNNTGKSLISKIGLNFGDMLNGGFVVYYGPEKSGNTNDQRFSFDSTWFSKPCDKLTLALQFNAGTEEKSAAAGTVNAGGLSHWYGASFQPKIKLCDRTSLGARYEWFQSLDGDRATSANALVPPGIVLQNLSIAPTLNLTESLMFRVEYRYDWSSQVAFETADGSFSNSTQNTLSSQVIYSF